ncbi:response regulator transcription factor [bacterium]|nr:response regulator transcription factor [bacterium]
MPRILVAEDDRKQAELIRLYLEREGHSVMVVHDGRTALERIREVDPDLVVLDVMMPRMDGLDVLRILRTERQTPVVVVTARSTEDDVLLGLDLGADDYVTKPFSPRELAARVRAVLRRGDGAAAAPPDIIGPIEIDRQRHEVRIHGEPVDLTPREFAILDALASSPGRAFTRRQLCERAFGFDYFGLERTVDAHVVKLRRKLGDDSSEPRLVVTVRGVGYRMADDLDG